jgi:hypothetical protein
MTFVAYSLATPDRRISTQQNPSANAATPAKFFFLAVKLRLSGDTLMEVLRSHRGTK